MFNTYLLKSSIKTLTLLWIYNVFLNLGSTEGTAPLECHNETALVCHNIGSDEDRRNALSSAFSGNCEIDLVLIICKAKECTNFNTYTDVINFIKILIGLVSTKYKSYIDTDRLHISVIVYDNTSARVTLNDITNETPKVGNCEFDSFLDNRMNSSEARGTRHDGKLVESLVTAKELFTQSARPNARKVLWLFSNCDECELENLRPGIELATEDLKKGFRNNIFVFTVGITQCPKGWFYTLEQENTMKKIASTNSSHFACIDSWSAFIMSEASAGDRPELWSEIINDVDVGVRCKGCSNSTSNSSNRCACEVSTELYSCLERKPSPTTDHHCKVNPTDPAPPNIVPTSVIALGAGIGGGCLLVVIIIVIIVVVVFRRRKRPGPPPPPLPRGGRTPPAPPDKPDWCPTYINSEATAETKIDAIEYEVLELERNMPGWADHLKQLKMERYPAIVHLSVYSVENDYFAQTAGFTLTESQKTALNDVMTSGNSGGNPRRTSDVTVGGVKYVIKRKTLDKLSAQTRDKKTILAVMCRYEYMVVGIAESGSSSLCDEVVRQILDAVTI